MNNGNIWWLWSVTVTNGQLMGHALQLYICQSCVFSKEEWFVLFLSPLIVLERTFCFHTSRYCIVHWTCEHLPCLIIQHFLNYIITFHMSHPWSTLCKHHLWLNVLQWCQHWCQHTISGWERGMGLDGIQVGWGMEHLTVDVDTAYILDTCEVLLVPQCTCHHVYIPNRRQSPGKPM